MSFSGWSIRNLNILCKNVEKFTDQDVISEGLEFQTKKFPDTELSQFELEFLSFVHFRAWGEFQPIRTRHDNFEKIFGHLLP